MSTSSSLWTHGYPMSTALQVEFCSASNKSSRGYYAIILKALLYMALIHLHWGYPSYDEQSGCICLILAVPRQKCRLHRWPHPTLYLRHWYDLFIISFWQCSSSQWSYVGSKSQSLKTFDRLDNFVMIAKAMPSLLRLPLCCQGSTHA